MHNYPHTPKSIDIEVTTKCNLKCTICQHTYWNRASIDMPFGLFQNILHQIPTLKSIKLHGIGEPLLNPSLIDMITLAKKSDLFVWTYSNGTLLHRNNQINRLLGSGLDLLRLSLDGTDENSYEAIRKGATWKQVVRNIEILIERRRTLALNTAIELWMVGMKTNIMQASKLVELGANLGVDAVRIQMVANTYDYKAEIGTRLAKIPIQQDEKIKNILDQAHQRARHLNITFEATTGKQYSSGNKCPWPFTRAFISAEGIIVPCGTIADPKTVEMGSIREKTFEQIWEGEKYLWFRNLHVIQDIPTYCQRCYHISMET